MNQDTCDAQAQQAGAEAEEGDGQKRANELDDDNDGVAVVFKDDENGDESDEDEFEIRDNSDSEEDSDDEENDDQEGTDFNHQQIDSTDQIIIGSDSNNPASSDLKNRKGKHDLTIYDVNGFWLQRLIGSHFPDPIEAESKTKEAINLLSADNSSLRDLENSPVDLSNYDKFELFSFLTKHRDRIVWGTKWSRSDEDEKVKLAVVMREKGVGWIVKALTTGRGISNPQFQATGLTSNKMDIDTEETKPTKFPTKANLEANSFLPNPKKVLDLSSMVFNQGSRTMTNKKYKLPKGSHNRRQDKATKRFTSHLPKKLLSNLKIWLKSATCPFGAGKHSKARLPSAESKAKSFRSHLDRTTRLYYVHQPEQVR
jgi:pre-mRNA-splicing helicase BRR2